MKFVVLYKNTGSDGVQRYLRWSGGRRYRLTDNLSFASVVGTVSEANWMISQQYPLFGKENLFVLPLTRVHAYLARVEAERGDHPHEVRYSLTTHTEVPV